MLEPAEPIEHDARKKHATSAGYAYGHLRDGLIWGRWKPGEKLKPQHLKEEFSTTSGALREALIRLSGEGFVAFEEQRGFSAIEPTPRSFYEVRHLRVLLETEGSRMSIRHGGLDWESNLAAAHQRLIFLEEKMRDSQDPVQFVKAWSRYDAQFHEALLRACPSDLLKREYRKVYDLFRLHAVAELLSSGFRGDTTVKEHNAILKAALARDPDACAGAIDAHLTIYRSRDMRDVGQASLMEEV